MLVLFCVSFFLRFSYFRFSIHPFWSSWSAAFLFFLLLPLADSFGSQFLRDGVALWAESLLRLVPSPLSQDLSESFSVPPMFSVSSGLFSSSSFWSSAAVCPLLRFLLGLHLSILFLRLRLHVLLLSSLLFLCDLRFLSILGFLCFRLLLRVQLCILLFIVSFNVKFRISFNWRRASGKFPRLLLHSSTSILQCHIGRCTWRRHLSPLVRGGHGDSIVCRLPYRLLYRACGDGLWSFFRPHRALFPVVIVGFIWLSAPSCCCVALGARRLATGPSTV